MAVRYNWDKWFSRNSFTLTRGKDFECQPHGMAQQIRNAAAPRGLTVSIKHLDGGKLKVKVN